VSLWKTSPLVVGHRGGRGEGWPAENTIDAFERARGFGARAIELDVRTCAGGEAIVFHDETLDRMTGGRLRQRVRNESLATLRAVELAGGGRIPTLGEALEWARDRDVAVNVELKHDVPNRAVLVRGALRSVRAARADVCLSSFDPSLLAMAAALGPAVPRALLVHSDQARWERVLQEVARPPLVRALHLERTQTQPSALARYVRRGLRLGVWTVNDEGEARELVRQGVETIITDAPGAILAALNPRK
jgi:glycerophosphoryl diester phosphodiesterase